MSGFMADPLVLRLYMLGDFGDWDHQYRVGYFHLLLHEAVMPKK